MNFSADDILFEDSDFLIVNKTAYNATAPDKSEDTSLYEELISAGRLTEESGVIHRLDRPVRGAVLFAKTKRGTAAVNRLLQERKIEKIYYAVLEKEPSEAEVILKHYIPKQRKGNRSRVIDEKRGDAREALLNYRLIGRTERYFLAEIELVTGRPHQIRAQMGHIGCPVKGDLKYGARRSNPGGGILLFAGKIGFDHPFTGKKIEVSAPLPEGPLWDCFPKIG